MGGVNEYCTEEKITKEVWLLNKHDCSSVDSQNHTLLELHHCHVLRDFEEIESINIYITPLKSESAT